MIPWTLKLAINFTEMWAPFSIICSRNQRKSFSFNTKITLSCSKNFYSQSRESRLSFNLVAIWVKWSGARDRIYMKWQGCWRFHTYFYLSTCKCRVKSSFALNFHGRFPDEFTLQVISTALLVKSRSFMYFRDAIKSNKLAVASPSETFISA